jgi:hypothetical protein
MWEGDKKGNRKKVKRKRIIKGERWNGKGKYIKCDEGIINEWKRGWIMKGLWINCGNYNNQHERRTTIWIKEWGKCLKKKWKRWEYECKKWRK